MQKGEKAEKIWDFPCKFSKFVAFHGKEEGLLFPVMKKAGIPEERVPIGVMLHEHKEGIS